MRIQKWTVSLVNKTNCGSRVLALSKLGICKIAIVLSTNEASLWQLRLEIIISYSFQHI